jgi:PAS domain S-box-containing protein
MSRRTMHQKDDLCNSKNVIQAEDAVQSDVVAIRAQELFAEQNASIHKRTDRLFAALLLFEWLAGIFVAAAISPLTWAGRFSDIHIHVWTALFLGGLICLPPSIVAIKFPGFTFTRHLVAVAQMLYSALLIHLTGGRIETHFHIFGSLAFLSFYRDWRVLIPATLVVALDHVLRGFFFPQSVYGVNTIEPWRWMEHAWWVVFENTFLIVMCMQSQRDTLLSCRRQADVECFNERIEKVVEQRTKQLNLAKSWANLEARLALSVPDASSFDEAVSLIIRSLVDFVSQEHGTTWGGFWMNKNNPEQLNCACQVDSDERLLERFNHRSHSTRLKYGEDLPGRAWCGQRTCRIDRVDSLPKFSRLALADECGLNSAIAFPIVCNNKMIGVFELATEKPLAWDLESFDLLGKHIGQFLMRKEAECQQERLAGIVLQSSDAIITATAENLILSWNKGAEKIFGYSCEEALGSHISLLMPRKEDRDLLRWLEASLKAGERIEHHENVLIARGGLLVDVVIFGIPWFSDSGEYQGCSLTFHNITERKEAERRVSEFYSIVSHELRTPLTSIKGVLGLIESQTVDPASDEAMELISIARCSANRLIRLINDMLDLKKIESGKMELNISKVDLQELISGAIAGVKGMAEQAKISIQSDEIPAISLLGDWDKLTQVITNLLSNAIKFSPQGASVRLNCEILNDNRIRITIIDEGSGIDEQDLPKLFDKFKQLDSSDTRSFGGTGLGLAISKGLVEQHDGSIGVRSTVGVGSQFWFELPAQTELQPGMSKLPFTGTVLEGSAKIAKVLVVDDDDELRRVLIAQLRGMGLDCAEASTGSEALTIAQAHPPELIMMEVMIPGIDGFGVVEALSKNESTRNLPLIIYTCSDLSRTDKEKLSLGATEYLLKGALTQKDLARVVNDLLTVEKSKTLISNSEERPYELSGKSCSEIAKL